MNPFRSPNRLPYNGNPEKSEDLLVLRNFMESPFGYIRKNNEGTKFYIFEIVGFKHELDKEGLPVVKPRVSLTRSLTKEEFIKETNY